MASSGTLWHLMRMAPRASRFLDRCMFVRINHCTGKVRPLRRVQGPPCAASAGSETSTERPQKHPPQPAAAPNGFPNLLTSANVTF
eukprot:g13789.t1